MNEYTFVVDTTAYSGNFERAMTAYIMGVVGECGAGEEFAELFNQDVTDKSISDAVEQRNIGNDYSVFRPCTIEPTPRYVNDGMGKQVRSDSEEASQFRHYYLAYQSVAIFFSEDPTQYTSFIMERARSFAERYNQFGLWGHRAPEEKIEILGYRILKSSPI